MNQPVKVPKAIYDDIIAHSRAGKPEEICGIVRGVDLVATSSKRAENIAEDRIIHYEVDSQTLLEFALHEDEMVGVYHSHPESEAYPSATDAWIAEYPNKIYFICSLEFDDAPVVRAFRMTPHYLTLDIPALRAALDFYQPAGKALPAALAEVGSEVAAPFYVVYYRQADGDFDSRVVEIAEHPIEVVG
jgi:proteasome lid subunit RPN8/RPN11